MNNKGNIHFLQNLSYFQKVSRLKLYLPKQKLTIKETFVFFKKPDGRKSNKTVAVFAQTEMNNE